MDSIRASDYTITIGHDGVCPVTGTFADSITCQPQATASDRHPDDNKHRCLGISVSNNIKLYLILLSL